MVGAAMLPWSCGKVPRQLAWPVGWVLSVGSTSVKSYRLTRKLVRRSTAESEDAFWLHVCVPIFVPLLHLECFSHSAIMDCELLGESSQSPTQQARGIKTPKYPSIYASKAR